jgi:hypothetical protein
MEQNKREVSGAGALVLFATVLSAIALEQGIVGHTDWYALLTFTIPLLLVSLVFFKRRHR